MKGSLVRLVSCALMVPSLFASMASSAVRARAEEGGPTPIQHIVVLMQENRSFDTYFSALGGGIPSGSNPNPLGGPPISQFHKKTYCEVADLDHSWNGTHRQWNNGAMDGFTATNVVAADPTGSRAMGYYDQTDLPFYYGLYNTFGTSDRYFASALTQTFPNRFYLLAGTSFGHIRNDFPGPTGYTQPTVFNLLDAAHVSWKFYYSQVAFADLFAYVRNHVPGNVVPISQYYTDAANGRLPGGFLRRSNLRRDQHRGK